MKVAFRVDASAQIGTGHFMRCLTLADALQKGDAKIRFVSRHLPEYLRDMLTAKGHEFVSVGAIPSGEVADESAYAHWLGVSQGQDATNTRHALSGAIWDWLVVDHYALDARWETALRNKTKRILVIDDIAERRHDCDVLLDQNFHPEMSARYAGKVPVRCRLLLGPDYALLRDEFRVLRGNVKPRIGPVKRVLVFFGGVDKDNCTGSAIDALASIRGQKWYVDVVIGAQHPLREQIRSACADHAFACHVQTDRMATLMAAADLAIGAGGSASWERCCLGLPSLIVSLADNQVSIAQAIDYLGAGVYIGPSQDVDAAVLCRAICNVVECEGALAALSKASYSRVDGLGVDRLREAMVH